MYEFGPVTDRVKRIHERVRNRVIQIDAERALIITDAYKKYETMLPILKRPLATKEVCERMTCRVEEDELFVGNRGNSFCGSGVNPEWSGIGWAPAMIQSGVWKKAGDGMYHNPDGEELKLCMTEEDYEAFLSIQDYWADHKVSDIAGKYQPEGYLDFAKLNATHYSPKAPIIALTQGHLTAGFEKIIRVGYGAIRKQAKDWIDAHKGNLMGDDVDKNLFYQSAITACDAASAMVRRYGEACEAKAAECQDAKRKEELEMMADGLKWISENPARTFWEACQAALLYQLFLCIDSTYPAMSFGRFDQYTYPYYQADLEAGRITKEQAQEIVDSFFLKSNCFYNAAPPMLRMVTGTGNTYQHTTIGGVDKKTGKDATNDVTYMVLESLARLNMHDPTISLRVNKDTPDHLWNCAIEATKRVGGLPLFQNDEIIIPALQKELNFELEDARDYSLIGCQEVVGSGNDYPAPNGGTAAHASVFFGVVMAMTINNGINPLNKEVCEIQPGYLYEMKSFEEVKEAFKKISEYLFKWNITMNNYGEYVTMRYAQHAGLSISMEGCMESGKDCTAGGCKYNSFGGTAPGMATVADSMTAIKYMVFDKKLCTARELYDAVMANWEGHDDLRQRVLHEVPHFGNNDPYADEQMKWIMDLYCELCEGVYSTRAKKYKPGLYGAADHVAQGYVTFATPDGRKTGEPLADAASPAQGRDKFGPTAVFNSCLCYDQSRFMDGIALNIKIHPTALSREDGVDRLRDVTKTYFENGGLEAQYNVVDSKVLRKAQENPEAYRDLVVRIAGYSAYFVEMNRDLQNDIISRTENGI